MMTTPLLNAHSPMRAHRPKRGNLGHTVAMLLGATLFSALPLLAERGSPAGAGGADLGGSLSVPQTPEEVALEAYNDGVRTLDRVWKQEEKAAGLDESKRAKALDKVEKQLELAARRFQIAVENNPALYQAHSDLGYSLRRLGRYDEALAAYDRALALNPNYPQALEYRGEAYLGLDRFAEARDAYARLMAVSPEHAAKLLGAVASWLEQKRAAGGSSEILAPVAQWLDEQRGVVRTAASSGSW
jgi:tetratricopeptide (TPR) repeat protein